VSRISKPYQVSDFILQDIRTVDKPSDWLIENLGTVIFLDKPSTRSSLQYFAIKDVGFFQYFFLERGWVCIKLDMKSLAIHEIICLKGLPW